MHPSNSKPFYLLDPKSPLIEANRFLIEAAVSSNAGKLAMSVAPEVVALKDVSGPQEIILALQHFPHHIEKMQGTLHFDFEIEEGTELFLPEKDWKRKSIYKRWFRAMSALEVMPFFVKDKDVRLYMLAGDYLAKGKTEVTKEEREEGRIKYVITGGIIPQLCKRLAESCKQFMYYCHASGFDPKDAIVSMIHDYTLPVHYMDIYKQYKNEIKNYGVVDNPGSVYRFRAAETVNSILK